MTENLKILAKFLASKRCLSIYSLLSQINNAPACAEGRWACLVLAQYTAKSNCSTAAAGYACHCRRSLGANGDGSKVVATSPPARHRSPSGMGAKLCYFGVSVDGAKTWSIFWIISVRDVFEKIFRKRAKNEKDGLLSLPLASKLHPAHFLKVRQARSQGFWEWVRVFSFFLSSAVLAPRRSGRTPARSTQGLRRPSDKRGRGGASDLEGSGRGIVWMPCRRREYTSRQCSKRRGGEIQHPVYFWNIQIQQLQHSLKVDETLETCFWNT
jgi:hypothetical protein